MTPKTGIARQLSNLRLPRVEVTDSSPLAQMETCSSFKGSPREIAEALLEVDICQMEAFEGTNQNQVYFCTLVNGERGVFKPASGEESSFWVQDISGTKYLRERAAYIVSEKLGLGIVPPTIIRRSGDDIGSFQQWVDGVTLHEWASLHQSIRDSLRPQELAIDVFHYCIGNYDSNGKGEMVSQEGIVFSCDNGNSFVNNNSSGNESTDSCIHPSPPGVEVPPTMRDAFTKYLERPEIRAELRAELLELLSADEVHACLARIDAIAPIVARKGRVDKDEASSLTFFSKTTPA